MTPGRATCAAVGVSVVGVRSIPIRRRYGCRIPLAARAMVGGLPTPFRQGQHAMSDSQGRVYSRIAGTGSYLPDKVLTNADLTEFVETSDEWIVARTGIRERHVAAEGETTSDLGYQAALRAMEAAGVTAAEIDLIILGTTTPDLIFRRRPACCSTSWARTAARPSTSTRPVPASSMR